MALETALDRATYFDGDGDDAALAEVSTVSGSAFAGRILREHLTGFFDLPVLETEGRQLAYQPIFTTTDEMAIGIQKSMYLLIVGHAWRVEASLPDGEGMTQFQLVHAGPFEYLAAAGLSPGYPAHYNVIYGVNQVNTPATERKVIRLDYPFTVDYPNTFTDLDNVAIKALSLADVIEEVNKTMAGNSGSSNPQTIQFINLFKSAAGI